jgi:hypothetical protein
MEGPIEEPFQEVKKRGPGRPRKVPLAPVPEAAAPVPEPLPVPEAAPEPEHSLRDVMERLEDMEKRLTPKPRVRTKPVVQPAPAAQPVQEQSGMGYLNARRAHKSMYHSFMPP